MHFTLPATRTALLTLMTAGALSLAGIGAAVAADDDWQSDAAGTSQDRTMESQPGSQEGFDQGGQGQNGYDQDNYDRDSQPGSQGGFGEEPQPGATQPENQGGFNEAPQQEQDGFDQDSRPGDNSDDTQQSAW